MRRLHPPGARPPRPWPVDGEGDLAAAAAGRRSRSRRCDADRRRRAGAGPPAAASAANLVDQRVPRQRARRHQERGTQRQCRGCPPDPQRPHGSSTSAAAHPPSGPRRPRMAGAGPDNTSTSTGLVPTTTRSSTTATSSAARCCSSPTAASSPSAAALTTAPSPTSGRSTHRLRRHRAGGPARYLGIFDLYTDTGRQSGSMNHGRWYCREEYLPGRTDRGLVGNIKLIYADALVTDSGRNAVQTETFDVGHRHLDAQPGHRQPVPCRSTPASTCCRTATSTTTPAVRSSTRWASPTTRPSKTALRPGGAAVERPRRPGFAGLGVPDVVPGLTNDDLTEVPLLDELPLDGVPAVGGEFAGARRASPPASWPTPR